ncbi:MULTISPECIES: LacI family DNA-binding transcriptional regulator [Mesorhizobium]|uniref:LacI family DNA-binding transcriptional regulator n=1 Tax=Mesorhizobium TaxID=68287 RepID=UPI0007EC5839|nr:MULTISPECIES: LacI family DNA-binding transcriptional regulator [Mesorhizobium]PBB52931.1 LacI family transcriptional regulator [Mesorhizobium loti]QIA22535.1 LacI family transcriptional regulator [Mesorhizobium sp. AA22]
MDGKNLTEKRGQQRVTLDVVAKHAGVSRSTASLVVRNSNLIAPETHERVRASMKALGYIYNQSAGSLRSQRTKTLGMVIADISNPFYALLASGIEWACHQQDFLTIFADTAEDGGRQKMIIDRLIQHNVAGVFLCPAGENSAEDLAALQVAGTPLVQIMRHVSGQKVPYIGPDNVAGVQLGIDHVVRLGRKKLAFIGGPAGKSSSEERLDGFNKAMNRHRLKVKKDFIRSVAINRREAMEAALVLLDRSDRPDAIICYNDLMAFGVMLAMQRLGLTPGKEVALVGFDDIPESALWTPALTTISIDARNIGRLAARVLLDKIANPSRTPRDIIVEPKLVIRESCGEPFAVA